MHLGRDVAVATLSFSQSCATLCRPPPTHVRPGDRERLRPHPEPANIPQLDSLPSAPPLPESQAHGLHAASSSQSPGQATKQHGLYPSLHASPHSGPGLGLTHSQRMQGQARDHQGHQPESMEGQTVERPLRSGNGHSVGQGGDSAEASPAVQPAGGLAWAVQTATGASSAAASALSAWLPWRPDISKSSAPHQEQLQQLPQAALQTPPSTRRWAEAHLCSREICSKPPERCWRWG